MAPQPHMMSDLCATHQSVTTLTVQQLYNSGFSLSVLTGTKSPHPLSSESDLPTDARKAQAPRLISSGHADLRRRPLSALASSCVGARCAWPGLALCFRLAIARWPRRFHQCPARRERQQTTQTSSSRLGAHAPGSASARNFSKNGWIASSSVCVDVTMRRFACSKS